MTWPVEIEASIVGAAFAFVGYTGKNLVDWSNHKKSERANTIAHLQGLASLLRASGALFIVQQEQVKRLTELLQRDHPDRFRGGGGFEDIMTRCYPAMSDEERSLHTIIRGYTEYSLRSVNEAVSGWLKDDAMFKTGVAPIARPRQLAARLFELEIHLLLWHGKFTSWIPGHPEHALVYLADESAQGLGFPVERDNEPGVQGEVDLALKELRQKWDSPRNGD